MEYIYSHAASGDRDLGSDDNVIHSYFPQLDHPDHGVLRTIIRDSQDGPVTNGALPTYLDSDGCVANGGCTNAISPSSAKISPADGQWHLITLTTQPTPGVKGLQIYVDGGFAGEMKSPQTYTDENGDTHQATGGAPITLDGTLHLCARADLDPSRFFSGSVANLRIFNSALQADQVKALYDTDVQVANARVAGPGASPTATTTGVMAATPPSAPGVQGDCATPCGYYNSVFMCTSTDGRLITCGPSANQNATTPPGAAVDPQTPGAPPAPTAVSTPSLPAMRINGQPACSPQPVAGVPTVQSCGEGYVCFPLSQSQLEGSLGGEVVAAVAGSVGVCTYAPDGLLLPAESQVPAPMYATIQFIFNFKIYTFFFLNKIACILLSKLDFVKCFLISLSSKLMLFFLFLPFFCRAFFPLSSPSLESFPLGEYKSINEGASVATDPLFGGSLLCNAADADIVALDAVPYGATNGSFSINIWVKPGKDFNAEAPLYLYSHRGTDAASSASANTGWGTNQVQIYFPQEGHPAYGLARAYVRDDNDVYTGTESQGYIDSDGQIGNNNGPRQIPFPVLDGKWHMLTITSEPQGGQGYRMYVDGQLAADLNARTVAAAAGVSSTMQQYGGTEYHVDGGDAMNMTGSIVLCSRSDDPSERHFDGNLAYLSLWDQVLQDQQVAALYAAVQQKASTITPEENAAPGIETAALSTRRTQTQRFSISGRACMFPALYNGEMIIDCVDQGVDSFCPVANDEWEACTPLPGQAPPPPPPTALFKESTGQASSDYGDLFPSGLVGPPGAEGASSSLGGNTARGALFSADGRRCQLPLFYRSMRVDNCVSFNGGQYCWVESGEGPVDGEWAECAEDALLHAPQQGTLGVGPSTVPVLQMQQPVRFTTDGEVCTFPAVHAGLVFDDCAEVPQDQIQGPACLGASGQWKECSLNSGESLEGVERTQLFVAERKTVSGLNCVFPGVTNDYLWFDCADVGGATSATSAAEGSLGGGSSLAKRQICPTTNATWEVCAPADTSFQTKTLE